MSFHKTKILYLVFICLMGCGPIPTSDKEGAKEVNRVDTHYKEQGYVLGRMERSEKGSCVFILRIKEEEGVLYDPINGKDTWTSDDWGWVKFARLRMSNRCDDRSPVQIQDFVRRGAKNNK